MARAPDILCIGSVLWDVIGRAPVAMRQGSDVAGRITRLPGGVAMNIAMTLAQFGMTPALLTAIGRDTEGDELVAACAARGMVTDMIYRSDDLPTDRYMAVEGANGLIAAIADAHSLEAAGAKILAPLSDGRLATAAEPHAGPVALDGTLTVDLLSQIAESPLFAMADLRVAPASPGKAERAPGAARSTSISRRRGCSAIAISTPRRTPPPRCWPEGPRGRWSPTVRTRPARAMRAT